MNATLQSMLEKFDGCDGGDPGTPSKPSIWLFGVEPGYSISDQLAPRTEALAVTDYSIEKQLQWPYNRNAFKLLAAIEGRPVADYTNFALERQPFVAGSQGYFKGNLYPFACNNVGHWPISAATATGIPDKATYQAWCRDYRWPAIKSWVDEHEPRLFIGIGNSFREQFSLAVFGQPVQCDVHAISVNGHTKKVFLGQQSGRKLVVIPHLSGGRNGLNSNEAIAQVGSLIRNLLNNS